MTPYSTTRQPATGALASHASKAIKAENAAPSGVVAGYLDPELDPLLGIYKYGGMALCVHRVLLAASREQTSGLPPAEIFARVQQSMETALPRHVWRATQKLLKNGQATRARTDASRRGYTAVQLTPVPVRLQIDHEPVRLAVVWLATERARGTSSGDPSSPWITTNDLVALYEGVISDPLREKNLRTYTHRAFYRLQELEPERWDIRKVGKKRELRFRYVWPGSPTGELRTPATSWECFDEACQTVLAAKRVPLLAPRSFSDSDLALIQQRTGESQERVRRRFAMLPNITRTAELPWIRVGVQRGECLLTTLQHAPLAEAYCRLQELKHWLEGDPLEPTVIARCGVGAVKRRWIQRERDLVQHATGVLQQIESLAAPFDEEGNLCRVKQLLLLRSQKIKLASAALCTEHGLRKESSFGEDATRGVSSPILLNGFSSVLREVERAGPWNGRVQQVAKAISSKCRPYDQMGRSALLFPATRYRYDVVEVRTEILLRNADSQTQMLVRYAAMRLGPIPLRVDLEHGLLSSSLEERLLACCGLGILAEEASRALLEQTARSDRAEGVRVAAVWALRQIEQRCVPHEWLRTATGNPECYADKHDQLALRERASARA